jgi:hypothetical protein
MMLEMRGDIKTQTFENKEKLKGYLKGEIKRTTIYDFLKEISKRYYRNFIHLSSFIYRNNIKKSVYLRQLQKKLGC